MASKTMNKNMFTFLSDSDNNSDMEINVEKNMETDNKEQITKTILQSYLLRVLNAYRSNLSRIFLRQHDRNYQIYQTSPKRNEKITRLPS